MTEPSQDTAQRDRPFRRTVFFISGFHDFGFRYFWPILKRESRHHSRLYGRPVTIQETPDGAHLTADDFGRTVAVDYRYMAWNDIAKRRLKQTLLEIYWHMVVRIVSYHLSGRYFRLMRAYWGFTNGVYYMLFSMLAVSIVTFFFADWFLAFIFDDRDFLRGLFSVGIAYVAPCLIFERYENYFRIKLMWLIFRMTLEQKNGTCADLFERLDGFEDDIYSELKRGEADEILIIGHSYGSILATELAGRLQKRLDNEKASKASPLSLLTIGDINALFVIAGCSQSFREMLAYAAQSKRLRWVTVFSPQDGLNFPKYNVAKEDLGIKDTTGPVFKSLMLKKVTSPKTYKWLKKSFWRMHFQYLREADYQNDFSFFRSIASARMLPDTIRKRAEELAFADQQKD